MVKDSKNKSVTKMLNGLILEVVVIVMSAQMVRQPNVEQQMLVNAVMV